MLSKEIQIEHPLIIGGELGYKATELMEIVLSLKIEHSVKFIGYIDDNDLVPIISQAKIFLYPSLYEGFGFPILEAMACGVPVISSNISSMPEVAGTSAILVDPYSHNELFGAIKNLIENDEIGHKLVCSGFENIKRFSQLKMARETLALYNTIL